MAAAKPRLAKALWDYVGNEAGDLTFQAGEAIKCTSMEGEWWTGETRDGQIGQFPSNYVKLVEQKTGRTATAAATTTPAAAATDTATATAAAAPGGGGASAQAPAHAVQEGGAAPQEASSTPAASTPAAAAGGRAPQNRAGSGGEEKEQKTESAAPVAANVSEVRVGVGAVSSYGSIEASTAGWCRRDSHVL
jgi:hypothetical protein